MPAEPLRFAYWVPNVSGGLVTSTIEQHTDWGYDDNRDLAVLAENNGFDYVEYFGRRVLPLVRELGAELPEHVPALS